MTDTPSVTDEDLNAFVSLLESGDSGPLLATALAIAQDLKRTRAMLREAQPALMWGVICIESVANNAVPESANQKAVIEADRRKAAQLRALISIDAKGDV